MDLDIWKYDDVRNWFNSYGEPNVAEEGVYQLRLKESGYTIAK
jgi:hypothetical protein